MIELRLLPLHGCMTFAAVGRHSIAVELAGVYVLMATGARLGSRAEHHVPDSGLRSCIPVAFNARDALVRARQREGCLRMVESGRFFPRSLRVAAGAAEIRGDISRQRACSAELLPVRILMTNRAREIVESEPSVYLRGRLALVTLHAGDRPVSPGQSKASFCVIACGERGRLKPVNGVAVLAAVRVRLARELSRVLVLVACVALVMADAILRISAGWYVALVAADLAVLSQQRISRFLMTGHREQRGFESLFVMTGCAVAAVRAVPKLTFVGIGSVAVHAAFVSNRVAEPSTEMTLGASHFAMLAGQRKTCRRVIETDLSSRLPIHRRVATLAGLSERPLVGIPMALGAGISIVHHIARERIWPFGARMAFCAGHGHVPAREREMSTAVIKSRRRLPGVGVVTSRAILAELAAVLVFMAGGTSRREPKEGPVRVPNLDRL